MVILIGKIKISEIWEQKQKNKNCLNYVRK